MFIGVSIWAHSVAPSGVVNGEGKGGIIVGCVLVDSGRPEAVAVEREREREGKQERER